MNDFSRGLGAEAINGMDEYWSRYGYYTLCRSFFKKKFFVVIISDKTGHFSQPNWLKCDLLSFYLDTAEY